MEYNQSERASGAWVSNQLLNLALFMGIGMLWTYNIVNFFLNLGKRSLIKKLVNGFIIPWKKKCVSITPPIKTSDSRALWHHVRWSLSIKKCIPIPAFCGSYKSTSHCSITGYVATFMDVSQKSTFWFLGTWPRSLWEKSNFCSY